MVTLQRPRHDFGKPDVVPLLGYRRTRAVDDLVHEAQQRIGGERVTQGGDLVRHAPERPHVALERVRLVGAHLRGEVVGRARHRGGKVVCSLQHPADAEVAQLDHPAAAEEDVLGLQVAVHDAHAVDVVQRECDLGDPVQHLPLREIPASGFRARDVGEQVAVLRECGDDAQGLVVIAQEGLLVSYDVRVAQPGQQLRLAQSLALFLHLVDRDALHHVRATLRDVGDEVHGAVVAVADLLAELILLHGERRARRRAPRVFEGRRGTRQSPSSQTIRVPPDAISGRALLAIRPEPGGASPRRSKTRVSR